MDNDPIWRPWDRWKILGWGGAMAFGLLFWWAAWRIIT